MRFSHPLHKKLVVEQLYRSTTYKRLPILAYGQTPQALISPSWADWLPNT
jgi:hypothetical protein